MSPFQEAIHERLMIANKKIASVMELDENFDEELKDIESELVKSGIAKAGKNPGNALKNLLTKWSDDQATFSAREFEQYRGELWMSL